MVKPIKTQLFASKAPLEWATVGNGILFTAQIPIGDDGVVVDGGITAQTQQTFDNLKHTLECAGASFANLTQVLIYVTKREDLAAVNRIYAEYVNEPFPNRAAIIVSGFAREEMLIEVLAYAVVNSDAK